MNLSMCGGYDLRVGEETKLPDRFLGKQIYAKLINFGTLPVSAEKNVPHGIADIDQLGIDTSRSWVESGGTRYGLDLPNTTANAFWRAKVDATNVGIQVGKDRSVFTAMICVWYTKASETVMQDDGITCEDVLKKADAALAIGIKSTATLNNAIASQLDQAAEQMRLSARMTSFMMNRYYDCIVLNCPCPA